MAEFRQGYLDDYTQITSGNIGIGTSISNEKLEIIGGTTSQELSVTGIATLTSFSGFIKKHTDYNENIDFDAGDSGTLSGEIIVGTGLTMTVGTAATASQGSVESLKVSTMFQPPSGTTNQRPAGKPGALFYNFDFKTIEFFDGGSWRQVDNISTGGRALFCGGDTTPSGDNVNHIDFCTISSTGSTRSFGDATSANMTSYGIGNNSRGIFHVGGGPSNTLEYVTIPSEGNSSDFGNLSTSRYAGARGNSSTRGIFMGGSPGPSNVIDYVEMMTLGNALDFGDLNQGVYVNPNSVNSKIRAFSLGGYISPGINTSDVESVKISSKGNAIKFGSIHKPISSLPGFSNDTRAIYGGGILRPGATSNIYIFNMFTQGESSFFGDLTQARYEFAGSCSQTRGIFAGGQLPDSPYPSVNTMDFITMASTGNAIDFGDMSKVARNLTSLSDCHGGLGGF